MALSDLIRKIEQSPRSTKFAIGAGGVFLASSAFFLYTSLNQPGTEAPPSEPIARAQSAPAPTSQPVPTATVPAPTPAPTPKINTPTPKPTKTPLPTATPGPRISDYYVLIGRGNPNNTIGGIEFFVNYPELTDGFELGGTYHDFNDEDFFLNYLLNQGTITQEQHRAYYLGSDVKVYLDDIAPAMHDLLRTRGGPWVENRIGFSKAAIDKLFLFYFDDSGSEEGDSLVTSAPGQEGYVVITDGSLETVITNDDGGTTRVQIETVDTEDLLEYLLRQGKITVEQKNRYGETESLEISLESAADAMSFFDWEYSSKDGEGFSIEGVDKESIDYIRKELLPLFNFD